VQVCSYREIDNIIVVALICLLSNSNNVYMIANYQETNKIFLQAI